MMWFIVMYGFMVFTAVPEPLLPVVVAPDEAMLTVPPEIDPEIVWV